MSVLQHRCSRIASYQHVFQRNFFGWLIEVFNRKDIKRIEEIGPDRGAAEWIVRNGGKIRFGSSQSWIKSYASLPAGSRQTGHKLLSIDGQGLSLSNNGLAHLQGLTYLEHLNLNSCKYISDLTHLSEVSSTLEHLDIGNCPGISDVSPIVDLVRLQSLVLTGTLGGDKRDDVINTLKIKLPECEITS